MSSRLVRKLSCTTDVFLINKAAFVWSAGDVKPPTLRGPYESRIEILWICKSCINCSHSPS